jgi:hypothetical protein
MIFTFFQIFSKFLIESLYFVSLSTISLSDNGIIVQFSSLYLLKANLEIFVHKTKSLFNFSLTSILYTFSFKILFIYISCFGATAIFENCFFAQDLSGLLFSNQSLATLVISVKIQVNLALNLSTKLKTSFDFICFSKIVLSCSFHSNLDFQSLLKTSGSITLNINFSHSCFTKTFEVFNIFHLLVAHPCLESEISSKYHFSSEIFCIDCKKSL